jgi:hypothetical protein
MAMPLRWREAIILMPGIRVEELCESLARKISDELDKPISACACVRVRVRVRVLEWVRVRVRVLAPSGDRSKLGLRVITR